MKALFTLPLLFVSLTAFADSICLGHHPRVAADVAAYDSTVAAKKAAFDAQPSNATDKIWVKAKLAHMYDVDQYMRRSTSLPHEKGYSPNETHCFWLAFSERFGAVDRANTTDMKSLLKIYDWFKISEFGKDSDSHAWILVQHADLDPALQRDVLKILERMVPIGETAKSHYAYLFDRVAASWMDESKRTLQRYGTQGQCVGPNDWQPLPMEEPETLDERRAAMDLEPFAANKARLDQIREICSTHP